MSYIYFESTGDGEVILPLEAIMWVAERKPAEDCARCEALYVKQNVDEQGRLIAYSHLVMLFEDIGSVEEKIKNAFGQEKNSAGFLKLHHKNNGSGVLWNPDVIASVYVDNKKRVCLSGKISGVGGSSNGLLESVAEIAEKLAALRPVGGVEAQPKRALSSLQVAASQGRQP